MEKETNNAKKEKLTLKVADMMMTDDFQSFPFLLAFEQLSNTALSEQFAWSVVESYECVQSAVKTFNEARSKLFKELGTEEPAGSGRFSVPIAALEDFNKRMDALLAGSIELPMTRKVILPQSCALTPKQRFLLVKAGIVQKPESKDA